MRTVFSRQLFLFLAASLCLLYSGCLTFKQTLTFNRDSSCVATYEYSFHEEQVGLWQNADIFLRDKQNEPSGNFLNESAVRKFFAENGLEVRQYRQYIENHIRHVEIIVLARDAEKAINSGIFGDFHLDKNALGDYQFKGSLSPVPSDLTPETRTRLQKLASGLSFQFRLKTPTAIISSNGRKLDYQQTEWSYSWPPKEESSSVFAPEPQTMEATW